MRNTVFLQEQVKVCPGSNSGTGFFVVSELPGGFRLGQNSPSTARSREFYYAVSATEEIHGGWNHHGDRSF